MEILGSAAAQLQNSSQVVAGDKKKRRSNSLGVRIVGTRIYDSANGKTCHQVVMVCSDGDMQMWDRGNVEMIHGDMQMWDRGNGNDVWLLHGDMQMWDRGNGNDVWLLHGDMQMWDRGNGNDVWLLHGDMQICLFLFLDFEVCLDGNLSVSWFSTLKCRQKTRDFSAACKNLKKGKPCPIRFCHKCLLNRYGEVAEEVERVAEWRCPKCRDICNCSVCEKKQGRKPTGQLIRMAKAHGFKSVAEMLESSRANNKSEDLKSNDVNDAVLPPKESNVGEDQKRGRNSSSAKVVRSNAVSPMKQIESDKELVVLLSGEIGKENSSDVNSALKLDSLNPNKVSLCKMSKKTKRKELKEISNDDNVDGAHKKKSSKRSKISEEIPKEEPNCDTKDSNQVSETGIEVDSNHDTDRHASGLQIQTHKNNHNSSVDHANDALGPVNVASQDYLFNPNQHDNAGSKFQPGVARLPNVGDNWEMEKIEEEIPLPPGNEITEILDNEFPPEAVGDAFQLLEFCRVFGKAIDLKKGEAEAILRELVSKRNLRRGQSTLVVQFQIRVLTLILIDSGNESPSLTSNGSNSWLKPLEDLITGSNLVLKDFPMDWLKEGISGYYNLDLSTKLALLNFLCDEALGTEKLRRFIEDENSRRAVEVKEAKSKVAAAKEKEKGFRDKLQKEMAKAFMPNVSPLQMENHDALLTEIKTEVAQAHAEVLELKSTIPKEKQSSDAIRIKPEFVDCNGHGFWKLKSYNGDAVLLQDIKIQDETATAPEEKWFVYGPEKKDEVDKYISSRAKMLKRQKVSHMLCSEAHT
ncbi:hypothetical protein Fmac_016503 [Flemingia macrophylla]|uniref:DDT domain-containing protein n=1 Tax=Flemingia macrophylla TaxID=520843 RepID=A0ABD1MHL7_9FABA